MTATQVVSYLLEDDINPADIVTPTLHTPKHVLRKTALPGAFDVQTPQGQLIGTIIYMDQRGWYPFSIEVDGVKMGVGNWSWPFSNEELAADALWKLWLKHSK